MKIVTLLRSTLWLVGSFAPANQSVARALVSYCIKDTLYKYKLVLIGLLQLTKQSELNTLIDIEYLTNQSAQHFLIDIEYLTNQSEISIYLFWLILNISDPSTTRWFLWSHLLLAHTCRINHLSTILLTPDTIASTFAPCLSRPNKF